VLTVALAAALAALAAVLLAGRGGAGPAAPAARPVVTGPAGHAPSLRAAGPARRSSPRRTPAGKATAAALPPVAAAAATLVGDLRAGVADGQVTQQAGQDLFGHLQPLLFGPPGQDARQIQDQYAQLVQAYAQHQSKGDITGQSAVTLAKAIAALGAALGAL
jgi:hypothetical protein